MTPDNIRHVGNTAQNCRLGSFQDSDFAGEVEDSKSTSGGILCIFGSRTFVPLSRKSEKQTSRSHSSTDGTTSLRHRAVKLSKAKAHVYLCFVRYFVLAKLTGILNQYKPGSKRLSGSRHLLSIVNWCRLTENQSSSSGEFSQNCSCFVRSKGRWKRTGLNLNRIIFKTTSIGEKKKIKQVAFRILEN